MKTTTQLDTNTTRSTYVPMPQWGWMIAAAAHINYCWTHNTCSLIAKTHADALSNYWVSRQQQGSCLCNCPQELTMQTLYNYYWVYAKLYRQHFHIACGALVQV